MKTAIISDFDGTISKKDVGYTIFHHFSDGKNNELLPDWKSGKMTSREVLLAEAAMVHASPEEITAYVSQFEIDEQFVPFIETCKIEAIPISVVSDGLDFYIRQLFEKYDLNHLQFSSNHASLIENTIKIEFNHTNLRCKRCGICKGEVIQEFKAAQKEPYQVVFIGDGYSDICAAREADFLFAKKDLKKYCLENSIDFYPYNNFNDIHEQLIQLKIFTKS